MRKAAAFILIFALMSGLCACGGGSGASAEEPEQERLTALLRLPGSNLFNEAFMYRPLFEQQLEQSKADERQREIFRGLVESLRLADYSSGELRSIVQEEMGAGAAPEQTARTILDRASLLIAERG